MEQSEIEVELLDWLTLIRETWGSENVQQSKDKVFKRIETAMQRYIDLCKGDGNALDWAELAVDASMELEAGSDDEFTALMDTLLGSWTVRKRGAQKGRRRCSGRQWWLR